MSELADSNDSDAPCTSVHVRARLCTVRLYKSEFSDEFLQWVRNSEDSEDSENSEASVSGSYEPGT